MIIQTSHVLFDIGYPAAIEQSKNKGIENSKSMRGSSLANRTGILSESDISSIMESIFNGPVPLNELEQEKGSRLFRGEAGNPIDLFSVETRMRR